MSKRNQKPALDIVFKDEQKKNEIRKLNAYPFYHDGRIESFIDLFNELYNNCMKYSKSKGNIWEYVYCKILKVFGVEYVFTRPKEEELEVNTPPNDSAKNDNKEEENKKGDKKEKEEEKKEEEKNEEKKEVEKNEEKKEEEVKNEDKKGGEG